MSLETLIIILAGLVSANLPFISKHFLLVFPFPKRKHTGWCLLELGIWMLVVLALGIYMEGRIGNIFPKGWEFYAIFVCLFLVASFPGFVWRFLTKKHV